MNNSITVAVSKISAILILFSLILASVYPVWAKDATNPATTRRVDTKKMVDERKQNALERRDALKDAIATRAAELKAKLQKFKDKVKASMVERINETFKRVNQNQTDQMRRHLDKMSAILTKLQTRVNETSSAGQDTSSANAAINDAKLTIASASSAVDSQASMDYTIKVSSESAAKSDTKLVRDKLHSDLQSARRLVIAAKQAVAQAIKTVAQTLKGVKYGQQ